jgi:hypothetical protein
VITYGANAEALGLRDISVCFGGGLTAIILEFLTKLARAGEVELRRPGTRLRWEIVADQARHAL